MRPKEIIALGVPKGPPLKAAVAALKAAARSGMKKGALRRQVRQVVEAPDAYTDDDLFGILAAAILKQRSDESSFVPRKTPAPYHRWGDEIEPSAVVQMENACSLPVAVRGALMPDAHQGYGLPIGGVLATKNAVIPYAVGMDIACRMRLTVIDWPVYALEKKREELVRALENETRFGVGASYARPLEHDVMDEDWSVSPVTKREKSNAWKQLGTSGSGNHFAEFGTLTIKDNKGLGIEKGVYLALLTHSGSRGTGAEVARYYSRLAMEIRPELPKALKHLAWLDLGSGSGDEYWGAMTLMGRYAAANHALIHKNVIGALRAEVLLSQENHHNFAWRENHFGKEVIVHRKGATPAALNIVGTIPGSMGTPGYLVRGLGAADSLNSAAHGAGRRMSRKAALSRYTVQDCQRFLKKQGIRLLSGGVDEVPMAYKDIESVMAAQAELVVPIARFDPKIVKMAP